MPGLIVKLKNLLVKGLKLPIKLVAVFLKFMLWLIIKLKTWLVKGLEIAVMLVMGLLVIDVVLGVFTRYVLEDQIEWTEELAKILLVWVSMLGASIGFIRKSHLGVDYFFNKLNEKWKIIGEVVIYLFVAFFASVALIYGGSRLVYSAFENKQTTSALVWYWYKIYLVIPICGFFIIIFCIETVLENILLLFKKRHSTVKE
ncbi:MAG: TRAP transporter small permease [Sedimentisphaerales bacterium]|nr:TRAP transporter small permease [Sedimentisphaerales bacterium]